MKLFLQTNQGNAETYIDYAIENNLNIELADFLNPELLNNPEKLNMHISYIKGKLSNFKGILSMHGPFFSIDFSSSDHLILDIITKRLKMFFQIAYELDAKYVILHSNFYPCIKTRQYENIYLNNTFSFFKKFIDEINYKGTILIENIFEEDPYTMEKLFSKFRENNIENIRCILDIGHINLFSKENFGKWMTTLKDSIEYFHFSNNFGQMDDHFDLFNGTINVERYLKIILKYIKDPKICLEMEMKLDIINENVNYMKSMHSMLFRKHINF